MAEGHPDGGSTAIDRTPRIASAGWLYALPLMTAAPGWTQTGTWTKLPDAPEARADMAVSANVAGPWPTNVRPSAGARSRR